MKTFKLEHFTRFNYSREIPDAQPGVLTAHTISDFEIKLERQPDQPAGEGRIYVTAPFPFPPGTQCLANGDAGAGDVNAYWMEDGKIVIDVFIDGLTGCQLKITVPVTCPLPLKF